MSAMQRTVTIDRELMGRADRKLRRYGVSFDQAVAGMLALIVSERGVSPMLRRIRPNGDMVFDDVEDAIGFLHAHA